MALRDLIRKRSSTSANSKAAIAANDEESQPPSLAKIAEIAIANPPEVPSNPAESSPTPSLIEVLRQFRFDLIEREIAAGYPADELNRANDLAWHFMQEDGLPFEVAIRIAADIVINCDPAPCEAAYESAMALWKRVSACT